MARLKAGDSAVEEPTAVEDLLEQKRQPRRPDSSSLKYGIRVEGVEDVPLRLAKCCRPVSGDPIVGYVSLGRGITIHREDCPNAVALRKDPERFVPVHWDGDNETSFKVELQVDGWDRHRLLEDLSRTFAEAGINIVEARCIVSHPMVKNRFVVEVGDTGTLKSTITRLRSIDAVFDAYRVTPTASP
jgi:GTP diphosphokinase / guanosine-3',5'-bis(diphosphate) 3'-diphosphatase